MTVPLLRLILLRHAEAFDAVTDSGDHARQLTRRGEEQAISTATQLAAAGYLPTLALVSDAKRTQGTWEQATGDGSRGGSFAGVEVLYKHQIYTGGRSLILEQVASVDSARHTTVILVGHNPHISELASELSGSPQRLAKADAVVLEITGKAWSTAVWQTGEWRLRATFHAAKS